MASTTASTLTLVQRVWPCVMIGSPLSPSQQSSSIERTPCSSRRAYLPRVTREMCVRVHAFGTRGGRKRLASWLTSAPPAMKEGTLT